MNKQVGKLIDKLRSEHSLLAEEYESLLAARDAESTELLRKYAVEERIKHYGRGVFVRGLIEIGNICRNDCLYCGIRRSNHSCERYRLSREEILVCCREGYALGFRTFVLQGGEDAAFNDDFVCGLLQDIKGEFPDCAITLSLGERSRKSYSRLRAAGADRYLLRHETASKAHYELLHPGKMSYERRMECLHELKALGYQTGCGFMVGSPYQTNAELAQDLKFIERFRPQMCGIGPFISHHATPFADFEGGSVELTCYLLSIIRLIDPHILLPATTALGSMHEYGREQGILSGANVIMPNLSPQNMRRKYEIYDNKLFSGSESAQALDELRECMSAIGYEILTDRGDYR